MSSTARSTGGRRPLLDEDVIVATARVVLLATAVPCLVVVLAVHPSAGGGPRRPPRARRLDAGRRRSSHPHAVAAGAVVNRVTVSPNTVDTSVQCPVHGEGLIGRWSRSGLRTQVEPCGAAQDGGVARAR